MKLIEKLGTLTSAQREIVVQELSPKRKLATAEVIDRVAPARPPCPHCGDEHVVKNGRSGGRRLEPYPSSVAPDSDQGRHSLHRRKLGRDGDGTQARRRASRGQCRRQRASMWRLACPERQFLPLPLEGLDAPVSRRRLQVPRLVPPLVPRHRTARPRRTGSRIVTRRVRYPCARRESRPLRTVPLVGGYSQQIHAEFLDIDGDLPEGLQSCSEVEKWRGLSRRLANLRLMS